MSADVVYISRARPLNRKVVPMTLRKARGIASEYSREVSVFVSLMATLERILMHIVYEHEDESPGSITSYLSQDTIDKLRDHYRKTQIHVEDFGRKVPLGKTLYGSVTLVPTVIAKLAPAELNKEILDLIKRAETIFKEHLMHEDGSVNIRILNQIHGNNHGQPLGAVRETNGWFISGTILTLVIPAPPVEINPPQSA